MTKGNREVTAAVCPRVGRSTRVFDWGFETAFRIFAETLVLLMMAALYGCGSDAPTDKSQSEPEVAQARQATFFPGCQTFSYNGTNYNFCTGLASWPAARDACRAQGDFQLARVDDAGEAAFIASKAGALTWWIGANDRTAEGAWRWVGATQDNGDQFWQGAANGSTVPGMFSNWKLFEPDDVLNQDCGVTDFTGKWRDQSCGLALTYICEQNPKPDLGCTQTTFNGHTYWACSRARTWDDARNHCKSLAGGDLVQIDNKEEDDFVKANAPGLRWIGGTDKSTEGDWQWADSATPFWSGGPSGSVVPGTFAKWSTGEPDNAGDADCAQAGAANGWADASCGAEVPYVCESRSPPDESCSLKFFAGREFWFCPGPKTWEAARNACRTENGRDLVKIDSADENAFVRSNISSPSWIGGNDRFTEGEWRWPAFPFDNGDQFWLGTSSGVPTFGAYTNWGANQPDNSGGQDCLAMGFDAAGKWLDDSCAATRPFVCRSAADICGQDPSKRLQGVCGCGVPETDQDGDGTPDCIDKCPKDPKRTSPGQCGCAGEPNAKPVGTPCNDGLCPANSTCDGAGSCGSVSQCAPAAGCTAKLYKGEVYWFCNNGLTWTSAKGKCNAAARTKLAQIDNPDENAFVLGELGGSSWLGGNDLSVKNTWRWTGAGSSNDGSIFWLGGPSGSPPPGKYSNWRADQPFALNDCLSLDPPDKGEWTSGACFLPQKYVCETCIPKNCAELGAQCGSQSDGCGGTLNCGQCAGGDVCFPAIGLCSGADGKRCREKVELDRSLPPDQAVLKFFTQLSYCSDPTIDPCVAQFFGAMRSDLVRATSLCTENILPPGLHNALALDRLRKERLARANPARFCQISTGDADKDRVPDPDDDCPNTPPLTPTDDRGCPTTDTIVGPSKGAMKQIRDRIRATFDPACAGVPPPPAPPQPVIFVEPRDVSNDPTHTVFLLFEAPRGVPPACAAYYEVSLNGLDPDLDHPVSFHFALKASEGIVSDQFAFPEVGGKFLRFNDLEFGSDDRRRFGEYVLRNEHVGEPRLNLVVTSRILINSGSASRWSPAAQVTVFANTL